MLSIAPLGRWIRSAGQDLRFGQRTLLRSPFTTAVMVISIALGIGVATAVFTLADVMLMRPLPYRGAERLVVPFQTVRVQSRAREDTVAWTFARYELLKEAVRDVDAIGFATWSDAILRLTREDRPIRVEAVTRSLLKAFSLDARAGRTFTADEDAPTAPTTVAMISDRLWRTTFGASRSVVDSTIEIDGTPVRVVGVMPERFSGFAVGADVWMPIHMMARIEPSARWTEKLATQSGTVIARMAPGLTTKAFNASLVAALPLINSIATDKFVADSADRGIGVVTLAEARRHPLVKPILELMAAAVIGLLAIVCANIASILLARGHTRRGEMGVRIALGASPHRVARQVLTECAMLAAFALPCGILLGWFCAEALADLRPALPQSVVLLRGTDLLAGATFEPNARILLFGALVAGLATLTFGIAPAIAASRVDAKTLIATSGDLHATAPVRGRQILVGSQIALATILLVSAGLMLRSLNQMLKVDLGFRPAGVTALNIASTDTSASARIRRADLIAHLSSIPGITSVATAGCVPFDLTCTFLLGIRALGNVGADRAVQAELHSVSSAYFATMGIALVTGRFLVPEDTTTARTAVVLSESAARQLFGEDPAVGKQVIFDQPGSKRMDVVGVAHDVRFRSVDAASSAAIYTLAGEDVSSGHFKTTLLVRSRLAPGVAASVVAREISSAEAPMSVSGSRALTDVVAAETSTIRFIALLLFGFAITALLLASLGVYGVIAYTVSQRTKELGLKMVLGADDQSLLMAMLRHGSAVVAVGLAVGVAVALGASRLVSSFLFGVGTMDAATYLIVAVVVTTVGLVATFVPARRILRIDAAASLRA
jgi:putative ABC transport system permease protein